MIDIGFQPLRFKVCEDPDICGCGDVSCNQLAKFTDKFSFQIKNDVSFLEADTILNGGFTTNDLTNWTDDGSGNAWSGATGEACVHPDSGILWQAQTLAVCRCYRLIFDLKSDVDTEDCCLEVLAYDGASWTQLAEYCDQEAEDDIVLVICPTVAYTRIGFRFTEANPGDCGEGDKCIDNIELRRYNVDIDIYDCCDDSLVDSLSDCDITFTEDNVLVSGLWSDYVSSKSCYKFCIDGFEVIENGTFDTDLTGWTQEGTGNNWAVAAARAGGSISFLGELKILTQTFAEPLYFTCDTELTFDIASITRGNGSADLDLYINGEVVDTFTTVDSHSYTLPTNLEIESIGFKATDTSNLTNAIEIDNVSIELDYCTDCICVASTHPFCTMLLTSRHSSNTSQFDFEGNDFKFFLRLNSRLINPRYPNEVDIFTSSFGVNTLNYSRGEKIWEYQMNRIPEYMWDAIQNMFNYDTLTIDGLQYVKVDGDIDPDWRRSNTKLASGLIEVKKQTEDRVAN